MAKSDAAPVTRRSFSRLPEPLEVPHLIDIQRRSFRALTDPKKGLLRETIDDISPIEDYTGNLAIVFGDFKFDEPTHTIEECREKDITYSRPLNVTVSFQNRETGEIREQTVFMGDFPWMTDRGTFIINGTERVVVTQLVRSPGAYVMGPKDREKQVFIANLMPSRGSWLELEIDKKGRVYARIDRKRKLPVTVLLRAMGFVTDEQILELFDNSVYIRHTIESDTEPTRTEEGALIELFKKQRPGEPPSVDAARALLEQLFFDSKRYDLTRVGRYKLNARLDLDVDLDNRTLTKDDIVALIHELVDLPRTVAPDLEEFDEENPVKDYAAEMLTYSYEPIKDRLDEYEHFGNRRLRTVGELIQDAFRVGLYRMERVVRERLTTEDADAITPQTIINIRPVVAAQKEFFGSSQLSQFMDQTNSLAGLTHRRRLSALGAGGLTRERAPIEVRDVHPTHYGRMCPIETPEGPNIGLIGSLSSYAEISEFGFVTTPYRVVKNGIVTDEIVHLDATQEEDHVIAQANAEVDLDSGKFRAAQVQCRSRDGEYVIVPPKEITLMDVSPTQIWSVATALIPFLEHDDANRALMGSNMQRQAVPLLKPEAPLIGTGMERRAAVDTGDVILAENDGEISYVDAEKIVVSHGTKKDEYALDKFMRSNQGTIIHQTPIVTAGDKVKAGDVLADGSSTDGGEIALGKNCLVAFMSWEGYNFEDAIILSSRLFEEDELTSIHIEEYEIDARTTKLGDEEITRDIPNRSEESLRNLDERGIVRVGAEVVSGDLLVGKVTPKGETELTAEEKLIRAIFKEKAREVRDTSLKVPHGEGGVVIDVITFDREDGDDLSPGVNSLVRVYVATKRKIAEGDKLAGRHGNKGVISKIVPQEDMPFLEDGTPVDVILNPLGVPSRMNIGQILETHLGWVAANGWYDDGSRPTRRRSPAGSIASTSPPRSSTVPPSRTSTRRSCSGRRRTPSAASTSGSTSRSSRAAARRARRSCTTAAPVSPTRARSRSATCTSSSCSTSSTTRSTPVRPAPTRSSPSSRWAARRSSAASASARWRSGRSRPTEPPTRSRRCSPSSPTTPSAASRPTRRSSSRENIPEPSIPESFKVLLKEIQSLSLDANLVADDGEVEMGEEDDELLRAAEELGIDLSGVRAEDGPGGAADEKEEQVVSEDSNGSGAEKKAKPAEVESE